MITEAYDASEQKLLLEVFSSMLDAATKDGGAKRVAGIKPPWWRDPDHEPAIFSHLNKWKHGEIVDKDSGAHPLVHLAWRALAIAYQETKGQVEPGTARAQFAERIQHYPKVMYPVYVCEGDCEDCTCNDESIIDPLGADSGICPATYYHLGTDNACDLPLGHDGAHENWAVAGVQGTIPLQWAGKPEPVRAT
jgi:hypothetical protein